MPKQIWLPSESDFRELGFEKSDIWSRDIFFQDEKSIKCSIVYDEATPAWYVSHWDNYNQFYPTSKLALIEFISNFSPNE